MHNYLPKIYYFIDEFNKEHIKKLNKNIAIIYRNYDQEINLSLIKEIKQFSKINGRKFFLANNVKIAIKLGLDGVYIPSFNKKPKILSFPTKKKFIVLGSAHNLKEIRIKENQNVKCIFLSPIFKVDKSKSYLDIYKFNFLTKYTKKKIICLGGLNKNNIKKVNLLDIHGFASISLFNKQNIFILR